MPKITIDGREIEVAAGSTIIQAAEKLGIFIPHYCYHPGLPIAGSCRMCLVEVEKAPKLQIACYTFVTDGMVVHTTTEPVKTARQAILEFLLANHPLDCPVCDQAGECKLQEFYMQFGRYDSTFLEDKLKKHKAIPVGPHIILDSERCILCSRCTRFVDEITHTHELSIFNRGHWAELLPTEGKVVDNPYSGCLADVCPVGALTDRDFRFKVRVWYLSKTNSVCHGCARGCSIEIHTNRRRTHHNDGKLIARYKPRPNLDVNGYWMCDAGRYSYKAIEADDRLREPLVAGMPATWTAALASADEAINRTVAAHGAGAVGIIAPPTLSNEEYWAVKRLFRDGIKAEKLAHRCPPDPRGVEDNLLRKADLYPNSFGAERILGSAVTSDAVLEAAAKGTVKLLIVIGGEFVMGPHEAGFAALAGKLDGLIAIRTHRSMVTDRAGIALPMSTFAETDGTVTNFAGHVQRYWAAIEPVGQSRPLLEILAELGARLEIAAAPRVAEACFNELAAQNDYFHGLTYKALGRTGLNPSARKDAVPAA
ncbi:MAG TPA: 2Fe-2S iron-sulfur cluster-binding protein [bacterium]|nr:2Fe-2S iron-sulfur cluster-binding protein [bacterium]